MLNILNNRIIALNIKKIPKFYKNLHFLILLTYLFESKRLKKFENIF